MKCNGMVARKPARSLQQGSTNTSCGQLRELRVAAWFWSSDPKLRMKERRVGLRAGPSCFVAALLCCVPRLHYWYRFLISLQVVASTGKGQPPPLTQAPNPSQQTLVKAGPSHKVTNGQSKGAGRAGSTAVEDSRMSSATDKAVN